MNDLRYGLCVFVALVFLVLTGCASPQPSGRRGLLEDVARADHSHRSTRLGAIQRGAAAHEEAEEAAEAADAAERAIAERRAALNRRGSGRGRKGAVEVASGSLRWPLARIQVTSTFGKRGREFHEGIDLKAPIGTPVYAAQDGTVIYAGHRIRGYGQMVVIRHHRQISTIYAHNSKVLIRKGHYVRQGQKIAISGKSGHVTGPHLHFEVRDGLAALDPLELLPHSTRAGLPSEGRALASDDRSEDEESKPVVAKTQVRAKSKAKRVVRRYHRTSGASGPRQLARSDVGRKTRELD